MGSGHKVKDVDKLLKQYVEMKTMMAQLMGGDGMFGGMKGKGRAQTDRRRFAQEETEEEEDAGESARSSGESEKSGE